MSLHSKLEQFEINIEPDGSPQGFRLFVSQDGTPLPSTSQLAPEKIRHIVKNYRASGAPGRFVADQLSEKFIPSVRLHLNGGSQLLQWQSNRCLVSKTQFQIDGGTVSVSRVCMDPDGNIVTNFSLLGESIVCDMDGLRMWQLQDGSGWFLADSALEQMKPDLLSTAEYMLEYDEESDPFSDDAGDIQMLDQVDGTNGSGTDSGTVRSNYADLPSAQFNNMRISFSSEMRDAYLKDVIFRVGNKVVEPRPGHVQTGISISPNLIRGTVTLNVVSSWKGVSFTEQDRFLKYFEYLDSHHNKALKKVRIKKRLRESALEILDLENAEDAEALIEEAVHALRLESENSRRDSAEYLRRFHSNFIVYQSECILADETGWVVAPVSFKQVGKALSVVQSVLSDLGGGWLSRGRVELKNEQFFAISRRLMAALTYSEIGLFHEGKKASYADVDIKVSVRTGSGIDWFAVDAKLSIDGKNADLKSLSGGNTDSGIIFLDGKPVFLSDKGSKAIDFLSRRSEVRKDSEEEYAVRRYGLLDWLQLKKYGATFALPHKEQQTFDRLLGLTRIDPYPIPGMFEGRLRGYQKEGYSWIRFLFENRLGGCLADDMGLGKTVQAIAFLAALKECEPQGGGASPLALVVAPPTLLFNWLSELEKFAPGLSCLEMRSGADRTSTHADVWIASYDFIRTKSKWLAEKNFKAVIFDEAQYLKNFKSKRTKSAKQLRADYFLTMTGTPLENHIGEYKSVLGISVPGLFDDSKQDRGSSDPADTEIVVRRSAPFVLRRTKQAILKDLPPKTESEVFLEPTANQKKLYSKIALDARRNIRNIFRTQAEGKALVSALTYILRLRQLCVSPRLLSADMPEESPKIDYICENSISLAEEGHSALIFSQFTSALDIFEKSLLNSGVRLHRLDGKMTMKKRKETVNAFQNEMEPSVFLISLKAGGFGLNLTKASYVYHLDPWWNPAVENQATDRTHRIGQKKSISVYRLIIKGTIEEKLMELKRKKQAAFDSVLGSAKDAVFDGKLSRSDFEYLLDGR